MNRHLVLDRKVLMHGLCSTDGTNQIDWGKTSQDYSQWRPDYPSDFYRRLEALGVGLPRQRILDVGTGIGFLAHQFARQGAHVEACDISAEQIGEAERRAQAENLEINYFVAAAEQTGLPDHSLDVISASQCWLYFNAQRMISEVHRMLRPDGVLVTSHFCWLPRRDPIAAASEALVLKFNPNWSAADWPGLIPPIPSWATGRFELKGMFVFDAPIPFTRESWRGRMRACRGVGAALPRERVNEFDRAHSELLESTAEESFTILHRIDCHILQPALSP